MRRRATPTLSSDWLELLVLAPQVASMRVWQAALDGGTSAGSRRESRRMVQEKWEAGMEASQAALQGVSHMQLNWLVSSWQAALQPWNWPHAGSAMLLAGWQDGERAASATLRPLRRRVNANARRLRGGPKAR